MGKKSYPNATELLITADGGGSNGYRSRLWKVELQRFANRTGLTIGVSHFPPGTSKWNKIEHRLFCHITENWRGRPLVDHETIVHLIGSVRTSSDLVVKAKLDTETTKLESLFPLQKWMTSTSPTNASMVTGITPSNLPKIAMTDHVVSDRVLGQFRAIILGSCGGTTTFASDFMASPFRHVRTMIAKVELLVPVRIYIRRRQ
jgi:hypothetical protein